MGRDDATAEEILREVVEPICRIRDRRKGYAVSYVKAALNLLGLPDAGGVGPVRPPLTEWTGRSRGIGDAAAGHWRRGTAPPREAVS